MEENLKNLLGDDIISQTKSLPRGMIDEEGEILAGYRPTGYPGVNLSFDRYTFYLKCAYSYGSPRGALQILAYNQSTWSVILCCLS